MVESLFKNAEWVAVPMLSLNSPCPIQGCPGTLGLDPGRACTCHTSTPCSACCDGILMCTVCQWCVTEYQEGG